LNVFSHENGNWILRSWGDISHLSHLDSLDDD
jgi:hypothetical protein